MKNKPAIALGALGIIIFINITAWVVTLVAIIE
jgi:hypothetical protein